MNLRRIEDRETGVTWPLHSRITVVVSDIPELLQELSEALLGDYAAHHPRFTLWAADDSGSEWPLTPDALHQMGLVPPISNLLRQKDVPGVLYRSLYDVFPDPEAEWHRAQLQRQSALDELATCANERAAWEAQADSVAAGENQGPSEEAVFAAQARCDALDEQVREAEAFRAEVLRQETGEEQVEASRARLERVEASIQVRIEDLTNLLQVDRDGLEAARALIAEAKAEDGAVSRDDEIARIDQLGMRYQELAQWRERLNSVPRPPQWVIAQTQGEYDEARGRFQALEYQQKQGIDCKNELNRARHRFEEAEAAWNALLSGAEDQEQSLARETDELCADVSDYLGVVVTIEDVGVVLQDRRQEVWNRRDARLLLGQMLSARAMVVTPENVVEVAESWLEGAPDDSRSDDELQLELAVAVNDLADVRDQLRALQDFVEQGPPLSFALQEADATLGDLRAQQEEARREHLALRGMNDPEYAEQFPEQLFEREAEARHILRDAEMRLNLLSQHAHSQEAVIADLEGVTPEGLQELLLTRLAAVRGLGTPLAFPLVLDRLTEAFPDELTDLIVTTVMKVSGLVPVLCLATPTGARCWADRTPSDAVGLLDVTHAYAHGPDQAQR